MPSQIRTSVFLLTAVIAAALIGGHSDRFVLGWLAFGVFNALAALRGTAAVRAVAALWASGALLLPDSGTRTAVAILAWLVWPPAFLVAWATAREIDKADGQRSDGELHNGFRARSAMAILIAVVGVAFMYRLLLRSGLHQTAALFVGLPALLAVAVVLGVSPRSAVGVACKATTVGLLVSLMFLGEGIVCVLMSAPLFYVIAVIVGKGVDLTRSGPGTAQRTISCLAVLVLIPMSFEGATPGTSFNRDEWVTETRIVDAPADAVERAMFETPRFDRVLPTYLAVGFPRPTATRIERAEGAARWVIRFRGGEMRIDGIEPRSGDLVLEIEEERPGFVQWRALSDDSHMTHYLQWRESRVHWEPVDAGRTRVTWTLRYRRGLDPAWYFGPWERYAVGLAAGYLIESVATP